MAEEFKYKTPTALTIDDALSAVDSTYSSEKIEHIVGEVLLITANYILPLASTKTGGRLIIKNKASTPLSVSGYSELGFSTSEREKIDGEAIQVLSPNDTMVIYSDGTEWYII